MMFQKTHTLNLFIGIILLLILNACTQTKDKGFSLRSLFGKPTETEEVFIDQYIDWNSITEYRSDVEKFYRDRNFRPAWFENDTLNRQGMVLMEVLENAWEEGLPVPERYLLQAERSLQEINDYSQKNGSKADRIVDADVALTNAYFNYASQMSSGILNPAELNVIWEILPDSINLAEHLATAIDKGDIKNSTKQLRPNYNQYELLTDAHKKLLQQRGSEGWPLPGFLPVLKEGESHNGIISLKMYLQATGDLEINDSTWLKSDKYDKRLVEAIKKFQYRHGLEQDGITGKSTITQMNVPLIDRIDQIRLNLDRIRWYPDDFGTSYIFINIPAFSFSYVQNGEVQQQMKVVVGENENYTPVLEDTLYAVVFNPSWNVPNSIATNEIFPKMLEDPTYMEKNEYSVLRDSYVSTDTIDYREYDWPEETRDSFPYFIVQHPGPANSLGRIQFLLQNQYSIFLHDTPAGHLFNIEQRDFSHGCVRLEQPSKLAIELLTGQLPNDTIQKYMSEEKKQIIRLEEKVPVHITYQTSWVDEDGLLHFREDIYGFDTLSIPALRHKFPELLTSK